MKWIIICLLLLSSCKTSKAPSTIDARESSGNYDGSLATVSTTLKDYHQIRTIDVNGRPSINNVLLVKDTPPPSKENPKINPQNVDSLKRSDQEVSGYNRHQSGSRFIDTLEDIWDAGGIGKDAILFVLLFIFAGIYVLIFGPMNQ